ncbi:MAG TPA: HDIG domain-containing protein [Tepidisphaeraceae bacterium]|jgi:putative nucleotidyltransferase with HDIG domain
MWTAKNRSRRADIRKARPDAPRFDWEKWKEEGILSSLGIAVVFFACATSILMWRQDVVPYRPGQWIPHNIMARVPFSYFDQDKLANARLERRQGEPRVYQANPDGDNWSILQKALTDLPERVANSPQELPEDLKSVIDGGAATLLQKYATGPEHARYLRSVDRYVNTLRKQAIRDGDGKSWPLVILAENERHDDLRPRQRLIHLGTSGLLDPNFTFAAHGSELRARLAELADKEFDLAIQPNIVSFSLAKLEPNFVLDLAATENVQNEAAATVPEAAGLVIVQENQPFILKRSMPNQKSPGIFTPQDWLKLREENKQYLKTLRGSTLKSDLGTAMLAFIITVVLAAYVRAYQPRIIKNHARAIGIAALLLSMLLLAQLTGLGSGPVFLLGVAPTLLVAMILTIAYEQRFAIGIASMHGLMATVALQQGVTFFIVIWIGCLCACFLLGDIRTRSKLIEIGGAMALAMMVATIASGFMGFDPARFVMENALYAGAAGLAVGFIVLGILPFIEKAFRITTSMTLLELADASQPLLRRLQIEAPGTYNHSLQVAVLAEAAAEAIGSNSLLARVGAYYHDVGKIHKAEYFAENQTNGQNRHLNLTPSVSLLIIIGHVKDGIEMAREYNLPTSLVPFIQQHHGTTLVEYFYHQACKREESLHGEDGPGVSEMQYRYPGPKPRSKEVAIVMICDAAESACRAMPEPTAGRVEGLVHDLVMRRLLDSQFDECDLTMRELEIIERSVMKSLMAIYHGRIQYPSTAALVNSIPATAAPTAARTA